MSKKLAVIFVVFLTLALFTSLVPRSIFAAPLIPPTSEGPGFILPDSPFFFLDEIKQNVRLLLSIKPNDRAEVLNSIAGERYAELRYMLARDKKDKIEYSLKGIAYYTKAAADTLADAQFNGGNVEILAESLNTDIKRRQEGLDILLAESTGELKTMVLGAQTSIYDSKAKVVKGLSPSKVKIELKNDMAKQTDTKIKSGIECNTDLLKKLENLKKKINSASEMKVDKENTEKESNSSVDNDKKKKLDDAYAKLEKAAKLCIESTDKFKATYNEFNKLFEVQPIVKIPQK